MAANTCNVNATVVRSTQAKQLRTPAAQRSAMLLAPKRKPSRQSALLAVAGSNGALVAQGQKEAAALDSVEKKYLTERANHVTSQFPTALGECRRG
jgi:hypothetical protein